MGLGGFVEVEERATVPFWELLVHTPAVFVRVAAKGLAGYGRWKNIRKMGIATEARRHGEELKRAHDMEKRRALGLEEGLRERARSKRARIWSDDHTEG